MKSAPCLLLLTSSVTAFAPQPQRSATIVRSTPVAAEDAEVENAVVYPTVNGWTADPAKFCLGLPGALAPMGEFDPLGFTKDLPVQEIKRYREAEVTHGRVAMLATVGYLVAEKFHPLFNGEVTGPANSHLGQVQEIAPFFFAWLSTSIATCELFRAIVGWERPVTALQKKYGSRRKNLVDQA